MHRTVLCGSEFDDIGVVAFRLSCLGGMGTVLVNTEFVSWSLPDVTNTHNPGITGTEGVE